MTDTVNDTDLQAYADGRLPVSARAEIERYLGAHPEDAERVRAWQELNVALQSAYNPILDEPVPQRLLKRSRSAWRGYAMAASFLAVGVAVGWIARGALFGGPLAGGSGQALARQAAVAHAVYAPEVRHPVEVGADQEEHLVKWLSKRLGTDVKSPALSSLGYELVGGRLLSGPQGPVAYFMYQDARGQRLTMYVSKQRSESRDTAFRFSQEDRVAVFYWVDHNYGYALSGEMTREALLKVADSVYKQFNP